MDVLIAPPTVEPISLATAKLNLKVSVNAEDALIDSWIAAARGHVETFCRRALVLQSRRLYLDYFPGACFELPRSPLRAVQSIQYLDSAGALQTLATTVYRVDTKSEPPRIELDYGQIWPATYPVRNAVQLNYTAGMLLPFTANAGTDILTSAGHSLADTDIVQVATIGGALPAGLAALTNYHVRDSTADTLKLAATAGGAAIDITNAGTAPNVLGVLDKEIEAGLHLLIQYFEGRSADESLMEAAELILAPKRVVRF